MSVTPLSAANDVIPTWRNVTDFARKRVEELRGRLEQAPPESVNGLQGQIRSLREIIDLPSTMASEAANKIEAQNERSGYSR